MVRMFHYNVDSLAISRLFVDQSVSQDSFDYILRYYSYIIDNIYNLELLTTVRTMTPPPEQVYKRIFIVTTMVLTMVPTTYKWQNRYT